MIIFGEGWIGHILKDYLKAEFWKGDTRFFKASDEEVWINTAAHTDIDWCEQNKVETFRSNVSEAVRLAHLAYLQKKRYVFFSSACVFESKDMSDVKYEDSETNPKCFYVKTKAMAEELIQEVNPDALIVRIRLPISETPHPRNTITKLLTYLCLNDNQESMTVIEDMLPVLKELIESNAKGIYHLINEGTISPAQIGKIFNHKFEIWSKETQDKELKAQGKTKRVTAYVGSKKIPLLPNIQKRILEIRDKYVKS